MEDLIKFHRVLNGLVKSIISIKLHILGMNEKIEELWREVRELSLGSNRTIERL